MSDSNAEKMKKLLADKKAKGKFLQDEKKIGSGSIEKKNKNIGNRPVRTKKIG